MSGARQLLIFGGCALAVAGMLYGLHYAIFVEHQTLDKMGGLLATAFTDGAERRMPEAHDAIKQYSASKYDYVRQVDVHSHWIGLGMLMIVLGAVFDEVAFAERTRFSIAVGLLTGSVLFPLGVILQTAMHGSSFALGLAIIGSALVIAALAAVAVGLARPSAENIA
jgi:hypothetical protein